MRNIFTWIVLVVAVSVANAQTPIPSNSLEDRVAPNAIVGPSAIEPSSKSWKAETQINARVFWVNDWSITNTFEGEPYRTVFTVFPDKAVGLYWDNDKQEEAEEASEILWNSVGISFDPKDNTWFDRNVSRIRDWHDYTIDTVWFQYAYIRRSADSIVDHIVLQTYKGNQLLRNSNTNAGKAATVGFSSGKGEGTNFTDSMHVPLTADDTSATTWNEGSFTLSTTGIPLDNPVEMKAGELFGVTLNFKSGVTDYDPKGGDTLYVDSRLKAKYDTIQKTRLNTLFISGNRQSAATDLGLNSPVTELSSFNNGMLISRRISNSTPTRYSPGGSYTYGQAPAVPVAFYPRIGVSVSAKFDVGLEEENLLEGFGLGVLYPNPASKNAELNISFAVDHEEQVNIAVYDLSGKKVMDVVNGKYAQGKHRTTFNASNLETGMYLYTMTAGAYSKTQRFTITD